MNDTNQNLTTAQFKEATPSRVYISELKIDIVELARSSGEDPSNIGDPWIRELAGQAGADFRTVKNWLNGQSTINDNTYNKLTDVVTFVKINVLKTVEEFNAVFTNQEATHYIIDWVTNDPSESFDEALKFVITEMTSSTIFFRANYPNDDIAIIDHHREFRATSTDIFNHFSKYNLYLSCGMTPRYNQPPKEYWGDEQVREVRCLMYLISNQPQEYGSIKPNWTKLRGLP